jgi:hypothetical protein
MPVAECQVAELKHAYQTLDVPPTASASAIKQAYRRIAKRWHPDLYPTGTSSYEEATSMMKLINEAYALIQHAPLRYHIGTQTHAEEIRRTPPPPARGPVPSVDTFPTTDRFEFWVRFVFGTIFGIFASLWVALELSAPSAVVLLAIAAIVIPACGFGAARYGDRFWLEVLGRWWFWP